MEGSDLLLVTTADAVVTRADGTIREQEDTPVLSGNTTPEEQEES